MTSDYSEEKSLDRNFVKIRRATRSERMRERRDNRISTSRTIKGELSWITPELREKEKGAERKFEREVRAMRASPVINHTQDDNRAMITRGKKDGDLPVVQ